MNLGNDHTKGIILLTATFLLAACSLTYELLIAQVISVFAGNTVVWYSLTIGIFLVAMGIGAILVGPILQRFKTKVALFWTELALCLLGALSPYLLHIAALSVLWQTKADDWVASGSPFFIPAIGIIFTIGFLTGIELPLLMQHARECNATIKQISSTKLLAADYFGSLVGALAFSLLLWPNFEPTQVGAGVATLNLFLAIGIATSPKYFKGYRVRKISVGVLTGMLVVMLTTNKNFMNFFLPRYYAHNIKTTSFTEMLLPKQPLPTVSRIRSPYQTIDLVQSVHHNRGFHIFDLFSRKLASQPNFPPRYLLFLNGEVQFFADFEEVYHEFFTHVPIAAFDTIPKKVLILGGGDGLLLRELLKYQEIESITLVDLDSKMIDFARSNPIMTTINNHSFEDPRVDVVIADAYHFVRTTDSKFDAVYMDFPDFSDYNLARLYSAEFYYFVQQHLSEDGFAVINASGIELLTVPDEHGQQIVSEQNRWPSFYKTFRAAGFNMIVPYFSQLEYEYPEAVERVIKYNLTSLPESSSRATKESAARLFLRYNTASLRSGFLMVSKDKHNTANDFSNTASPLYVINDARYKQAFKTPLQTPQKDLPEVINSIFRPKLSGKYPWSIRRPLSVYSGVFAQ